MAPPPKSWCYLLYTGKREIDPPTTWHVNESYEELSNIKVQMFHGHSPRHILRNLTFHKISSSNTASYICRCRTISLMVHRRLRYAATPSIRNFTIILLQNEHIHHFMHQINPNFLIKVVSLRDPYSNIYSTRFFCEDLMCWVAQV